MYLLNNPLTRTLGGTYKKIGVIGLGFSGKTVFLTSLIDHLLNHDPEKDRFDLGEQSIRSMKFLPTPQSGIWEDFRYEENRARMANKFSWPKRTSACSMKKLRFRFSQKDPKTQEYKQSWLDCHLDLYDIPGQRLTDILICENNYADWSQKTLDWMECFWKQTRSPENEFTSSIPLFLKYARYSSSLRDSTLVDSYKRALINIFEENCAYVTPSIFLMDEKGTQFIEKHKKYRENPNGRNQMCSDTTSGIPGAEFTPLGKEWEDTPIYRQFQKNYEEYRKKHVLPIFGTLLSCDSLVFLFDLALILKHGVHEVNMYREIIGDLLNGIQKRDGFWNNFWSTLGYTHKISKIAFAAAQCDRFHPDDYETLKKMVRHIAHQPYNQSGANLQADYFFLSAVTSAHLWNGKMAFHSSPDEISQIDYWRIPAEWSNGFPDEKQSQEFEQLCNEKGQLLLPRVRPNFDKDTGIPPRQINLDKLFRFLTNW